MNFADQPLPPSPDENLTPEQEASAKRAREAGVQFFRHGEEAGLSREEAGAAIAMIIYAHAQAVGMPVSACLNVISRQCALLEMSCGGH